MSITGKLSVLVAALLVGASQTWAGSVNYSVYVDANYARHDYEGQEPWAVTIIDSNVPAVAANGQTGFVGVGEFSGVTFHTGAGTSPMSLSDVKLNLENGFQGFCIDLNKNAGGGEWRVANLTEAQINPGTNISIGQANAIQYLWHEHFGVTSTRDGGAEFQMAVWKILYGDKLSFSTVPQIGVPADMMVSTTMITTAEGWANTALSYSADKLTPVYALISESQQGFSVALVAPVPLPTAAGVGFAMLGGSGLISGLWKWRSAKKRIA